MNDVLIQTKKRGAETFLGNEAGAAAFFPHVRGNSRVPVVQPGRRHWTEMLVAL